MRCLEAVVGVLGRYLGEGRPPWTVLDKSGGLREPSWAPLGPLGRLPEAQRSHGDAGHLALRPPVKIPGVPAQPWRRGALGSALTP